MARPFQDMRNCGRRAQGSFRISRFPSFLLLILSLGAVACEENLAPRDDFDAPFTMYGVLSPDLDTQSIRVYPVEDFPTLGTSEPLEVDVFSTNLETGERLTWRDTVLVDPNGQHEYIYSAPFRAQHGHGYRVEVVRRSDGARSFAEVRVPEPVTVRIADEEGPTIDVSIEGEGIRALKPEAEYVTRVPTDCVVLRNRFSYEGRERRAEGGWRVRIHMLTDRNNLIWGCGELTVIPATCPPFLTPLRRLDLHLIVGDVEWDPPGGVLDPNIVSEHSTMTNVDNGFGFIGAGYRIVETLFPSEETLENACFFYVGD